MRLRFRRPLELELRSGWKQWRGKCVCVITALSHQPTKWLLWPKEGRVCLFISLTGECGEESTGHTMSLWKNPEGNHRLVSVRQPTISKWDESQHNCLRHCCMIDYQWKRSDWVFWASGSNYRLSCTAGSSNGSSAALFLDQHHSFIRY